MSEPRVNYTKTTWTNDLTALNATNLNKIEAGIFANNQLALEDANYLDELYDAIVRHFNVAFDSTNNILTITFGSETGDYQTPRFHKEVSIALDTHSSEITSLLSDIAGIKDGSIVVKKAEKDKNGNDIVETYETKSHATSVEQTNQLAHQSLTTEINKKINTSDIVNDLNTDSVNKPLSAAQGKILKGFITDIQTILNSNDTDLDTIQEIVSYIKNNKTLIENITTNKVNVSDIVDNLTSTATNKPLSANQGHVLKGLIDSANESIQYNEERIHDLEETKVDSTTYSSDKSSIEDSIDDEIDARQSADTALSNRITANENARHTHSNKTILDNTTASFTSDKDTKLSGIEAGAEVNIIESVKINGSALQVNDKEININLSGYATNSNMDTFAKSLDVSIDENYVATFTLKDANGNQLSTNDIDLPIEGMVVDGSYDSVSKKIVLELDNGSTVDIPISDIISGLAATTYVDSELDLKADKADHYNKTAIDGFLNQIDLEIDAKEDPITFTGSIVRTGDTVTSKVTAQERLMTLDDYDDED